MQNTLLTFLLLLAFIPFLLKAEDTLTDINDATAFLAGVELPHQQDHPLTLTPAWKNHVAVLGETFAHHQERVLFPMSAWSATEISPTQPPGAVVRYLFSGPDILHAFYLFPKTETFILCGLEPVGEAPSLTALNEGNAHQALDEVRNALGEIINLSFFRTKDMKDDLHFATFQGVTPLMMIFLAQSGQYIKSIEFLKLQKDGSLLSQARDHRGANVVKMEFSPRRLAQSKTLYYFSSDLSDGGFAKSGFETWISAQPKGTSYLKAASFLLHDAWFSKVRQHLLDYSHQVVQDDSGIPFRFFDGENWKYYLYGVYSGPIDLFPNRYQSDLTEAYKLDETPLPFGTGYKWRKGESNLMRFVHTDLPAMPKPKPEMIAIPIPLPAPAPTSPPNASGTPQTTSAE